MEILKALKFVQGAVAKKDFVAALTHYNVADGRVVGYNGRLALGSPIDCELSAKPRAEKLVKAIQTCEDETELYLTKAGRLAIKSGDFLAHIECTEEPFPDMTHDWHDEETQYPVPEEFVEALKELRPFVSNDASRPWANGVFFAAGCAFATNNVVLIRRELSCEIPICNIPAFAINELVRVGAAPDHMTVTDSRATFFYEDGRWVQTNLLSTNWPESIPELLSHKPEHDLTPLDSSFFDALDKLLPFIDKQDRVYIDNARMSTHQEIEEGASFGIGAKVSEDTTACMNGKQLAALRGIAQHMDLSQYPRACPFKGETSNGVIIGIRQ